MALKQTENNSALFETIVINKFVSHVGWPWRRLGGVASLASIGATVAGCSYISHQVHSLAPPAVVGVQGG